ncbi:hypothetical protein PVK06_027586 [Gossypium arboreum]|uniref:RNase H type-1 domain-containing protein n=1 Tax=Gossypium arboreum TaxID=29729 RepID=A0ABR0P3W6_GOSAR|nr:hypothetical protein PVK06_027586 [Gossypium arboreum]
MKGVIQTAQETTNIIISYIFELDAINERLLVRRVESERWRLSEFRLVNINYSATFQSYTTRTCIEIMVRNFNGFVLGSRMIINYYIPLIFGAEALTCFLAVQMGLDLGFLEVKIEGDALTMVKKLNANNQDNGETTYMLEEVPSFADDTVEKDEWWTDLPY